jgi:hypothetical protein
MFRQPVSSRNLRSVGYDAAQQILEIEFNSCAVHRYQGVPQAVYQGLTSAESHGKLFHAYIRDRYPTECIA